MSSYKVYKAYFKRREDPEQKYDLHVALFVRTGSNRDEHEGKLFHAIEHSEMTTDKVVCLTFDCRDGILENHSSFKEAIHIGSVPKDNVKSIGNVCRSMPGVVTPHTQEKPDCVTWIDNLIYDLNKSGIVTFESGFKIPSSKKPLQAEGYTFPPAKDKGSASSSKDKGSASSSKDKGSASSSKDKGSSSSSKSKGSSSSGKHKGRSSSNK